MAHIGRLNSAVCSKEGKLSIKRKKIQAKAQLLSVSPVDLFDYLLLIGGI